VRNAQLLLWLAVLLSAPSVGCRPAAFSTAPRLSPVNPRSGGRAACCRRYRARPVPKGMRMGAGGDPPFYPLSEILHNVGQLQLAVAREDYGTAARLRDANQALRERDEFTRLCLNLGKATVEQRFEDAAELRDEVIAATKRRAAAPPSLNRLLLLSTDRALATCNPDGSDVAPLTAKSNGQRYAQPTWSPSGDMVAAVCYTGTALSR